MTLKEIRDEIDKIDASLLPLFLRRMECTKEVAEIKREKGLPVLNEKREQEVLDSMEAKAGEFGGEARLLYSSLMTMSRALQHRMLGSGSSLREEVQNADSRCGEPHTVACLGQEGSFSHEALQKLYPQAKPLFSSDFSSVFAAVKGGKADLGVVPVENSLAGSVGEVYDLILKYRFRIVRALSLPVRHCLASSESSFSKIRTVCSHPQALHQCSEYLARHGFHPEPFSSTAEAAHEAKKPGVAAICSEQAARCRGLHILERDIQNCSGNRTRFLVISRLPVIPENAAKISLCFSLPHRTGTLYAVLARFAAAGLNLTKIESRPIPGKNFEYDFYLDFSGNVRDAHTLDLLCALKEELPRFSFLGNYAESE